MVLVKVLDKVGDSGTMDCRTPLEQIKRSLVIKGLDLEDSVIRILVGVGRGTEPNTFVSVTNSFWYHYICFIKNIFKIVMI